FVEADKSFALKKLKTSGYAMLSVFAIVAMLYTSFTYTASSDDAVISQLTQMTGGNKDAANSFYNALKEDRQSLFGKDILRSLLFAAEAFGCLWLYVKNKLKSSYAMIALVLLS